MIWIFLGILIIYVVVQTLFSRYYLKVGKEISKITFNKTGQVGDQTNPPLKLFISGDSVGAGVGAETFEKSVPGRTAQFLSRKYVVDYRNESISGSRMADLLTLPKPSEKQDVMLLIISSNDLFRFTDLEKFETDTKKVIEMYLPLTKKLIILGPGRVFDAAAIPFPLRIYYKIKSSDYGDIIKRQIAPYPNITNVDLTKIPPSKKEYGNNISAIDQFHPNNEGHRFWFEQIIPALPN